jgi:hypothetical protein
MFQAHWTESSCTIAAAALFDLHSITVIDVLVSDRCVPFQMKIVKKVNPAQAILHRKQFNSKQTCFLLRPASDSPQFHHEKRLEILLSPA